MLKEVTYKEKLSLLDDWLPVIMKSIHSDLKTEHLKKEPKFLKVYFANKNPNKITQEELVTGYRQALEQAENAEALAEFLSNRWMLKNTEVYHFFEQKLIQINPNFTEMQELEEKTGLKLMQEAIQTFGPVKTYLFSVFNSVVFSPAIYEQLREKAKQTKDHQEKEEEAQRENLSISMVHQSYQLQISRLTDKYEKKLQGLQKKYLTDTESLKKQIAHLQRKLNG